MRSFRTTLTAKLYYVVTKKLCKAQFKVGLNPRLKFLYNFKNTDY